MLRPLPWLRPRDGAFGSWLRQPLDSEAFERLENCSPQSVAIGLVEVPELDTYSGGNLGTERVGTNPNDLTNSTDGFSFAQL